ncbi:TonB-dependent receptor plug domain-containing protein [Hymenobacter sp. BT770]|uniref:TonB-dependent receptor n=1 Tax=Hymenobacter sp. BT770 TaxID=2886942 RepID=UPI001D0F59F9|nr:TonB-dependent receptor plug domain-containing protein [Hymenobacter sp. BT770]MCC3152987.1 TonB-dependent receptor plug domain-containing protein [Hymenobacter sp. BT770]MDO3415099.1 TonB-dependent receptor plug domain-containing protein [Hymenobacter sp. BT770]
MKQPITPGLPPLREKANRRLGKAVACGLVLMLVAPAGVLAQNPLPSPAQAPAAGYVTIIGTLRDANGLPLELAAVGVEGQPGGTNTTAEGDFSLQVRVPAPGQSAILLVRRLGYLPLRVTLKLPADAGEPLRLTMRLDVRALSGVKVTGRSDQADTREQVSITHINPRTAKEIPSAFGDFNAILKTLPGVTSNNELSSTYNVRGGNYDENLVYVNGFEIYRPFLVTSAQQEGLSFINPDMVKQVEFSSGGWQPKYGDKLASVLSIDYKTPEKFAASLTASLVGGAAHTEARSANGRVSYLAGVRYKNAQYVLRSLKQAQGGYNPTFYDAQAFVNIGLGKKDDMQRTTLGLLGVVAHNDYRFSPETGQATFSTGTNQFTRVFIAYDGRERMQFDTYQSGFNLKHDFSANLQMELLGSALISREFEYRDVEAAYRFADINRDPTSPDFNQTVRERNIGSQFKHSRNHLTAQIYTAETRGRWTPTSAHTVRWGAKIGREKIEDTIDEYSFADSADFVPDARRLRLRSDLSLLSTRSQGFVQDTWSLDSLRTLTYGARAHYWTTNGQLVISPRVQYSQISRSHPNRSLKAAVGVYYQPPFYRELRDQQTIQLGVQQAYLNPELRAQKSYHFIVGKEISFQQFGRPFKFSAEAYYKYLTDVVPYDVDNVRLRYFAKNNAKAYAAGFDTRLSGEFVKGAESWFSLGVLTTREDVNGDSISSFDANGKEISRRSKGFIRRPQDQRLNVGVFFQDHLPNNPSVRGYVNLVFGTGLPFSPPNQPDLRGTNALERSYKRVDLGFSKVIGLKNTDAPKAHFYSFESLWLGLEILNVLAANNVAGYSYLQDVNGVTYSVPSYLSQRLVNLRLIARF